jgi:hypothetical protein
MSNEDDKRRQTRRLFESGLAWLIRSRRNLPMAPDPESMKMPFRLPARPAISNAEIQIGDVSLAMVDCPPPHHHLEFGKRHL